MEYAYNYYCPHCGVATSRFRFVIQGNRRIQHVLYDYYDRHIHKKPEPPKMWLDTKSVFCCYGLYNLYDEEL